MTTVGIVILTAWIIGALALLLASLILEAYRWNRTQFRHLERRREQYRTGGKW